MSGTADRKRAFTRKWRWINYIWPRMGLRRYMVYLVHRIGRLPGTAHNIAAGFASGAAMSMTPFIGLHFLLGALLAWVLRGNLLASAIGTVVGNPWTFPFIWMYTYRIGARILGHDPQGESVRQFSIINAFQDPVAFLGPVMLPMMIGSALAAIVVWFSIYWAVRAAVEKYKKRRIERRHRRAIELMTRLEQTKKKGMQGDDS